MNILTSWRESLRVFEPTTFMRIAQSSWSAIGAGMSLGWSLCGIHVMANPQLRAHLSMFCDAHLWGAASTVVTVSAVQDRVSIFTPQKGLHLLVAAPLAVFVGLYLISQIMSEASRKKQRQGQQYRQLCDEPLLVVGNDSVKLRITLMFKIFSVITALLFSWVALVGLARHFAAVFHIAHAYISYVAYFMLMPHAPLKEIYLGSYLGSFVSIWPHVLALGVMGACWPVCVLFSFFMVGGRTSVYTALRNSVRMIVSRYPAFLIVRLAIHAFLMITAAGGHFVQSLGNVSLYFAYWYVMGFVIAYASWQFLWQLIFVLYQIWAPQIEQASQQPQDHNHTSIVLDSASN